MTRISPRALLLSLKHKILDSEGFLGPVLILLGGTAGAHLITACALVLVARLYSPEMLGVLGIFSSIVYTLSVAICLRFEIAILLPDEDDEARDVLRLAIFSALGLSLLLVVAILILERANWFEADIGTIKDYMLLVPLGVFTVGVYTSLQNWYIRKKQYRYLASTRMAQSGVAASVQVGTGLIQPVPMGLIAGFILNSGAAAILLGLRYWRDASKNLTVTPRLSIGRLYDIFRKYSVYPKYSIWEALANSGAIQLPVLLIGILSSEQQVGYLILALSIIQAPLALFGNAIAQVFIAQAPKKQRDGVLREFTVSTLIGLLQTGALPLLFIGLVSPFLFPYIFGDEWQRSGILVAWMTPWFILQFLTMPVSLVLHVTGHQIRAAALQIFGLFFRLGMVWIALEVAPEYGVEVYAVSGGIFYFIYLMIVWNSLPRKKPLT